MTDIEKVLAIVEQLDVCEIVICNDCPLFNLCYKRSELTIGQIIVLWLTEVGVLKI